MLKKLLVAVVAVIVMGAVITTWYWQKGSSNSSELVLYGNVDIRVVSLAFNASARIQSLNVQEGDKVKIGEILGKLDAQESTLKITKAKAQVRVQQQLLQRLENGSRPEEIAQAQANVRAAKVDANLARQELARLQNISRGTQGRAVSKQDIDRAEARLEIAMAQLESRRKARDLVIAGPRQEDIAQAKAQLAVAEAELALLQYQLSETVLKSPVDSVVRSRLLEPGDMASPQRPVFSLAITKPKWVRAYVTEVDLGLIHPGMAASIITDSHPGEALSGKVGYISSVAEFTPKIVQTEELRTSLVYETRILVDDPQDRLRLGMPATVRLHLVASKPVRS
ncbi:MAG: HlyD family efflux transporter periplasmic adaptor subunit [Candidatus Nitrosoglobus sp.]